MSNYHLTLAFFMPDLPSSRKFVLVALADTADDYGVCYPSMKHIIAKTSLDRKTVIDSMRDLHSQGYISKTGEMKGKTKQIPVIRLELSNSTKYGTLPNRIVETVPNIPPNSPVFPAKESQKRDTEPLVEPLREPARGTDDIWFEEELPSKWYDAAADRGIPDAQVYVSWRKFKDHTSLPYRLKNWRGWVARERVKA